MKYGEVTKTLKKNSYFLEEKAKEAAGFSSQDETTARTLEKRFKELTIRYDAEKDADKQVELLEQMSKLTEEVTEQTKKLMWWENFETALKVMDILFVEGSSGLTKENFSKYDAKEAYNDFFSAPKRSDKDSQTSDKK